MTNCLCSASAKVRQIARPDRTSAAIVVRSGAASHRPPGATRKRFRRIPIRSVVGILSDDDHRTAGGDGVRGPIAGGRTADAGDECLTIFPRETRRQDHFFPQGETPASHGFLRVPVGHRRLPCPAQHAGAGPVCGERPPVHAESSGGRRLQAFHDRVKRLTFSKRSVRLRPTLTGK